MNSGHQGLYTAAEVLSTQYLLRIGQNPCTLCMTRCYYSLAYKFFYLGSILLSIFLIVYMLLHDYSSEWWFFSGELLVTGMMCIDLVFLAVLKGWRSYLKTFTHQVEVGFALLCVTLVIVGFLLEKSYQELDEGLSLTLMLLRSVAQYARLVILLKNLRRTEQSIIELNDIEEIDLDSSDEGKNISLQ